MREFSEHYLRGLGLSVRNNALAFGYSVTITASLGMLMQSDGPGSVLRIFMFVIGSSIALGGTNRARHPRLPTAGRA